MPVTLRRDALHIKDEKTGQYKDPSILVSDLPTAISELEANAKAAIQAEGNTQKSAVTSEGTTQKQNVNTAGANQVAAIEAKGEETKASIPDDYSTLSQNVNDLKRQFDNLSGNVEVNTTDITANAERIAELFPTVISQPYIKELYLKGYDPTRQIVTNRIVLNHLTNGVYVTGINLQYKGVGTVIARYYLQPAAPITPTKNEIVEIVERNSSGVSGYAVIDFTEMSNGDDIRTQYKINMDKVGVLEYNPIINGFLGGSTDTTGIVYLNKDSEIYMYQAYTGRSNHWNDTYTPLRFIHFSDVHRSPSQWERLCDYIDAYENYIQFAIHTGDYVGSNHGSYDNHYAARKPLNRNIYNVVGNHDSYASGSSIYASAPIADTYQILFGNADVSEWGATFGSTENAMYYYKDFADSGIRLIVIDQYYWDATEASWLDTVLSDALTRGLWVITAMHTVTGELTNIGSSFFTKDAWGTEAGGLNASTVGAKLASFVSSGGVHICHLSGHYHHDKIGLTSDGLLEIIVECNMRPDTGSIHSEWDDSARVRGNKSWDAFNYVSVNRELGLIKIVRIGCNIDDHMQSKKVLCYDFVNRQIVSNF